MMPPIEDAARSMDPVRPDVQIDARGLKCPGPVLELKAAIGAADSGQLIQIIADDPHARLDFQVFCARTGHHWVALHEGEQSFTVLIRKC